MLLKLAPSKYQHVVDVIREEILSGRWPAGQKVSTERELVQQFQTTRATVHRAMNELVGLGLVERHRRLGTFVRARREFTAGIVFDHPIFSPLLGRSLPLLLHHLEIELTRRGWATQYFLNVKDAVSAERIQYSLNRQWLDGVIVSSLWFAENVVPAIKNSSAERKPAIVGVYPYKDIDCSVIPRQDSYGKIGVERLYARGCRRIALVAGTLDAHLLHEESPEMTYRKAMQKVGLPADDKLVRVVPRRVEEGFAAFQSLWSQSERPDGIVVDDEMVAQGVVRGIVAAGARTPDDIILASQVAEGASHLFAIPFIEMRTPVQRWAVELVAVLVDETTGVKSRTGRDTLAISVHDPFDDAGQRNQWIASTG